MFESIQFRWLASLDGPGGAIDQFLETFTLQRFNIFQFVSLSSSQLTNLELLKRTAALLPAEEYVCAFVSFSEDGVSGQSRTRKFFDEAVENLPRNVRIVIVTCEGFSNPRHEQIFVIGTQFSTGDFPTTVGGHIGRFLKFQKGNPWLAPSSPRFPEGRRDFGSIESFVPAVGQFTNNRVVESGVNYDFLADLKEGSDTLIISGQSALSRGPAIVVPLFQRWSWYSDFPTISVISINDPGLYLDDTVQATWWFGTPSRDYVKEFTKIIQRIMLSLDLPSSRLCFTGGSAGGFSSLQMATCLKGSSAVIDIPQIDMRRYSIQNAANHASQVSFGIPNIVDVPSSLAHRVDVTERFKEERNVPNFFYLQNVNDQSHLTNHFSYFIEQWAGLAKEFEWARRNSQIELYSQFSKNRGGHFPLGRADTVQRVLEFMEIKSPAGLNTEAANYLSELERHNDIPLNRKSTLPPDSETHISCDSPDSKPLFNEKRIPGTIIRKR